MESVVLSHIIGMVQQRKKCAKALAADGEVQHEREEVLHAKLGTWFKAWHVRKEHSLVQGQAYLANLQGVWKYPRFLYASGWIREIAGRTQLLRA